MCTRLKRSNESVEANRMHSKKQATQHTDRALRRPALSDHDANAGVAANSTRLRIAVSTPNQITISGNSICREAAISWNRKHNAGVLERIRERVLRNTARYNGSSCGAFEALEITACGRSGL